MPPSFYDGPVSVTVSTNQQSDGRFRDGMKAFITSTWGDDTLGALVSESGFELLHSVTDALCHARNLLMAPLLHAGSVIATHSLITGIACKHLYRNVSG